MSSSSAADVAVIGGGPAGATVARLLALWGHSVVLTTRPSAIAGLAESIPPSCDKLFRQLGIDMDGFLTTTGNTVWWGNEERVVSFADGAHGWQVERARFDAMLLQQAVDAGVRLEPTRPAARWTLDCSGRAGVIARQGYRVPGTRTLALIARWGIPAGPGAHTLVESYENGWAWSVPYSEQERCIAFMIHPALESPLADAYDHELARTAHFKALAREAKRIGATWACDASSYSAERFTGDGVLLVGDAASFVDPLSSFGIKKALASAWLAAIVVNTLLSEPELRPQALQFYESRERAMYESLQQQSALLANEAGALHNTDFWQERAIAEAPPKKHEQAARAAFEDLKQRDSVHLQRSAETADLPVVRGNRIALATHFVSPAFPEGVRYIRDVDLIKLAAAATEFAEVHQIYEAYNRSAPPVALEEFLVAISVAIGGGILVHS